MASAVDRKIARIVAAIERRPELGDLLCDRIDQIERLERRYRKTHWGDDGDISPGYGTIPDIEQGVVVLGELVEVAYLTRKGRRSDLEIFEHQFHRPWPLLCEAPDGRKHGLVIVRGKSNYNVRGVGIVG